MILYKSHCREVKTFYGETFHYGETKAVCGYIHDPRFVCLGTVKASYKLEDTKPESKNPEPKETKKTESKTAAKTVSKSEKKEEAKKAEPKKFESKKDTAKSEAKDKPVETDKKGS